MFLWDWFQSVLTYFGIWFKRPAKVVFIGLDNAGKSTLLFRLKEDKMATVNPSQRPTCEEMVLDGVTFTAYDLGGHPEVRRIWRDYFPAIDAIVFLVDASDRIRFQEAKEEIDGILVDEQLIHLPLLILGNKLDKATAACEEELRSYFGLHGMTTGKVNHTSDNEQIRRPMELFMCSVLKKQGYGDGFRWLAKHV